MKRTSVKKVVLGFAVAAFIAALVTLGIAFWAIGALGGSHVATASLFATVFFFVCVGIVLYFMSLMPKNLHREEVEAARGS